MIGIFDSGCGGLTVLRAIRDALPSADVVYFGDTKNAPYGSRSREDLSRLTVEGLKLLQERGATNLVSACNSVSASLAVSLLDAFALSPQQLIEMVGPTVRYFKETDVCIGLCATEATISSGIYQNAFTMIGRDIVAFSIPELAGAIEAGKPEEELERIVRESLESEPREFDVLVLACTHYPLVLPLFQKVLDGRALVFDPAVAVAERVEQYFWPQEVGKGSTLFLLSQESLAFRALAAQLFPDREYTIQVLE